VEKRFTPIRVIVGVSPPTLSLRFTVSGRQSVGKGEHTSKGRVAHNSTGKSVSALRSLQRQHADSRAAAIHFGGVYREAVEWTVPTNEDIPCPKSISSAWAVRDT